MKTRKLLLVIGILSIISISFTSCEKTVLGCTDPDSDTYNPEANEDNNTCQYTADLVIWWGEDMGISAYNDLGTYPTFDCYVNGTYAGALSTSIYYESAPNCNTVNGITASVDLGYNKTGTCTVSYVYQGETVSQVLNVQAGCNTWRETW